MTNSFLPCIVIHTLSLRVTGNYCPPEYCWYQGRHELNYSMGKVNRTYKTSTRYSLFHRILLIFFSSSFDSLIRIRSFSLSANYGRSSFSTLRTTARPWNIDSHPTGTSNGFKMAVDERSRPEDAVKLDYLSVLVSRMSLLSLFSPFLHGEHEDRQTWISDLRWNAATLCSDVRIDLHNSS